MNRLVLNNAYNKEEHKHYEGAFAQGNGYMNMRASFEEDLYGATQNDAYWRLPANVTLEEARHPKSKWGIYVPGIYGQHPILGEEIVNLPYVIGMNIYQDNERLDMEQSQHTGFVTELNMSNGLLSRNLVWKAPNAHIEVAFKRYCSLQHKHLIVQELALTADADTSVSIENFIDADVTTNGYNHFTKVKHVHNEGLEVYLQVDSGQKVVMRNWCEVDENNNQQTVKTVEDNRIKETYYINLLKGETTVIKKYSMIMTSIDTDLEDINLKTKQAEIVAKGIDFAQHEALWDKKWNQSDIIIKGDRKLQESVRFSIYHLLRSVNDNSHVAIDAKGYAGEAYFGHYFWDTEIYLLPFFIYTQPEYAKKLITYRYKTLEGAKENAKRYGYKGARYPWEACITGLEQCSNWQYADLEVHVTADVIYGLWHYYDVTKDIEFLMNEGLEMMVETARYWASRVDRKGDAYHLMGVMGPDEYLPFTNNNAFTNYMVKFALEKTLETLSKATEE